jgi:hypothetical protein
MIRTVTVNNNLFRPWHDWGRVAQSFRKSPAAPLLPSAGPDYNAPVPLLVTRSLRFQPHAVTWKPDWAQASPSHRAVTWTGPCHGDRGIIGPLPGHCSATVTVWVKQELGSEPVARLRGCPTWPQLELVGLSQGPLEDKMHKHVHVQVFKKKSSILVLVHTPYVHNIP